MNILLRYCLAVSIVFSGLQLNAQQLVFRKLLHNFGEISPKKGQMIKHNYFYTNESTDTLFITSVTSDLSALQFQWQKGAILPGENGSIEVSVKADNLKMKFRHIINVRSNDKKYPYQQLIFEGLIIDNDLPVAERYPLVFGNLKFKRTHLVIDHFYHNTVRSDSLEIYNSWDQPIKFDFESIPDYLKATPKPSVLDPGKEGVIIVEYDALKSNHWGLSVNAYRFKTNEPTENAKTFTIGVNIKEDFSILTKEEKDNAPVITFNKTRHQFGKVAKDTVLSFEFSFTNEGKRDLIIRKTKASCGCTSSKPTKTLIKPGEEAKITVSFNTRGYSGKQSKTVTVVCNDPNKPVNILTIEANIGS